MNETENVENAPIVFTNPGSNVLGGTPRTDAGSSGSQPNAISSTSGTGTGNGTSNTTTSGTGTTDPKRDLSTGPANRDTGVGKPASVDGTIGNPASSGTATQPATAARRGRKPRTATGTDATATGTSEEKPSQTVLELAAPVSINLNTGRRSKAKTLAIKPESIADALVLGFGVLEKQRGPHWKRTKAECEPFSKSIAGLIPDLPPELLKTLEKSAPWVSLAVTGTMLFLPSILAELNIAKMRAELAELERKNGIKSPLTNNNSNATDRSTVQSVGDSPAAGEGVGNGSTRERAANDSTNATNDSVISPFGKFGNVVI